MAEASTLYSPGARTDDYGTAAFSNNIFPGRTTGVYVYYDPNEAQGDIAGHEYGYFYSHVEVE